MLSAVGAGAVSTLVCSPIWVAKTRLQAQVLQPGSKKRRRYRHTLQTIWRIIHIEGFTTLYKGLVPSLFGLLHVAIQFPCYEYLKATLSARHPGTDLSAVEIIFCSGVAKVVASSGAYPHEVIRSRLHDHHHHRYKGLLDCVRQMYHTEGLAGFYHGWRTNLVRITPSAAITFLSYEYFSRWMSLLLLPPHERAH